VRVASNTYNGYIAALRRTLAQAGFTRSQIESLIATYARIPRSITTNVRADTGQAESAAARVRAYLNSIHDRYVTVTVAQNYVLIGRGSGGRQVLPNRWGSVIEYAQGGIETYAAQSGMLDPGVYSGGRSSLIKFAEPATGGEAYVPRRGDTTRSKAIIDVAAAWYGGNVVWSQPRGALSQGNTATTGATAGASKTYQVTVNAPGRAPTQDEVVSALRHAETLYG
jgi:hypothetical protein